jgi:hypothetical protein
MLLIKTVHGAPFGTVLLEINLMSAGLMISYIKTPKHVAMWLLISNLYVKNKRLAVCEL